MSSRESDVQEMWKGHSTARCTVKSESSRSSPMKFPPFAASRISDPFPIMQRCRSILCRIQHRGHGRSGSNCAFLACREIPYREILAFENRLLDRIGLGLRTKGILPLKNSLYSASGDTPNVRGSFSKSFMTAVDRVVVDRLWSYLTVPRNGRFRIVEMEREREKERALMCVPVCAFPRNALKCAATNR